MSNTVKLIVAANKTVLAAHPVSARVSAPEGAAVVEATVYGPTAYNRFIHNGRYVAKEVVEQIWVALANGEQAVKARKTKQGVAQKVAEEARTRSDKSRVAKNPSAGEYWKQTAVDEQQSAASAAQDAAEPSLEDQLTASIARNLKVEA